MAQNKELKLLIVDDHLDYFELVKDQLSHSSCAVPVVCRYASSSAEALSLIENWHPSIVVLDVHSTPQDNIDLMKKCQAGLLPVITISENGAAEIDTWVRQHGASGHFIKSEDPEQIEELLTQAEALSHLSNLLH